MRVRCVVFAAGMCWLLAAGGWAAEQAEVPVPDSARIRDVQLQPAEVQLARPFDYVQLLVTGRLESGETVDLTRQVQWLQPPRAVEISSSGLLRPLEPGRETLELRVAGRTLALPVTVDGSWDSYQADFIRDVAPVLSKVGCNAGTCHGANDGQNGFKLSLRGYDYQFDHQALTDDVRARRFNPAAPDQSLMLLKPTAAVPHVGGKLFERGGPYYELLRQWIVAGCSFEPSAPRVQQIQLFPREPVLPLPEMEQQMRVLATYSDGTTRDVTREAVIESGDIEIISADSSGRITTHRRGEAPVLARYEGAYTATIITIMGDRSGFVWEDPPVHNYVDELVYAKLQRVKVQPSELCSDAEFVRRVYLDLTGLPPTAHQVRQFLEDTRPTRQKRDELIDRLIGSPEYVQHWTNKWGDLLQVNRKHLGAEGAAVFRGWIEQAVASNMPYDEFARTILTASGSTLDEPAASYWKILREPSEAMENTTQLFLAVRFNCNKCHDHPFERWTQDQYYQLTAFFAQVGRKPHPQYKDQKIGGSAVDAATPAVEVVFDKNQGEINHLRTGQRAQAAFPYVDGGPPPEELSRRRQLALWLTDPENRYFATSFVNRLWGYLLGVGLIEPIDDIRAGNPPTNPELLQQLTQDFIDSQFDVQHMLRVICRSRVYQHALETNRWNEDDQINYSHAIPRRLRAEVLYDAIHFAAGSKPKIPGVPAGVRAAQLPDAGVSVSFLEDFGRPPRESSCECERNDGVALGPIMRLVNGPTVAEALADPDNALSRLNATVADDEQLIEQVFLRFLGRPPSSGERQLARSALDDAQQDFQAAQGQLDQYLAQLDSQQTEWEARFRHDPQWTVVSPLEVRSELGAEFQTAEDGAVLAGGPEGHDTYEVDLPAPLETLTGLRLEALSDSSLPKQGPGRAPNGNFVLSELQLQVLPAEADEAEGGPAEVKLENASADFSQQGWPVTAAIDGDPATGWAVVPQTGRDHEAIFETAEEVKLSAGARLRLRLVQKYPDEKHLLGRFRVAVTASPPPFTGSQLPDQLKQILALSPDERTDAQQRQVRAYYRQQDATYRRLAGQLEQACQQAQNRRLTGLQDLAWALINTPAFLFNR